MSTPSFVDYYEILQASPNADTAILSRSFRYLAKRYHPDNPQTGNLEHFNILIEAYRTLTDPVKRTAYDLQYQEGRALQWRLLDEAVDTNGFTNDRVLRHRLLSLLYVQRRRDIYNPGLGNFELEQLLGCPGELLEFHLWYLREKGWITLTDRGFLAITIDGVEQVETAPTHNDPLRLLPPRAQPPGRTTEESAKHF